jgi:beta-mannosidase
MAIMMNTSVVAARLCGTTAGVDLSGLDVDEATADWIDVTVPGDVRAALVAAGRLADPDRDATDAESAWVDDLEWWYRFDLPAPSELRSDESVVLRFDGIDTFATVYVDGVVQATSTNMFRTVEVDVTAIVATPGRHVVAVRIEPPWARLHLDSARGFDDRRNGPRPHVRKAQFGYGWDFAPNQPSIGLWRPVTLRRRQAAWLESVRFQTLRLDGSDAVVAVDAFVGGSGGRVVVRLSDPTGREVLAADAPVVGGVARIAAIVVDAQLWWPHSHGTPTLHDLHVELVDDERVVDSHDSRVGIRTAVLDESPDPDAPGKRFFRFVVNGRPIFAKGANWVPSDIAVGCVDAARYRPLLEMACAANMNMVRIWGGGVYEHDAFYEICDELGVLVWQEFMFACYEPPDEDDDWLADIRAEATDQVRRLRSHPCIVLWCGNNEIEAIAMINDPTLARSPAARIFYEVLPQVVAAEDGVLGYVPTSPMLGNGSDQADRHNWDVWHALAARQGDVATGLDDETAWFVVGVPLGVDSVAGQTMARGMSADQYLTDMSPFPSEFGLRSMPARPTLERWIDAEHLDLHDAQITLRNRDNLGPTDKIELAASLVAGRIETLDDLIDLGQFTQAEGLKLGCEYFRRRWPHCGGELIWQLNDCWPAPTWSLIDHAGRGKGALAYAARFYAPVLASFVAEADGGASLWVTNDLDVEVHDVLTVRLHHLKGGDLWTRDVTFTAAPSSSAPVASWSAGEIDAGPDRALLVTCRDDQIPANRMFFVQPKDLVRGTPNVTTGFMRGEDGRVALTFTADAYALFVHALAEDPSVRFDDNYFDLAVGEKRTITSLGPVDLDGLSVKWL